MFWYYFVYFAPYVCLAIGISLVLAALVCNSKSKLFYVGGVLLLIGMLGVAIGSSLCKKETFNPQYYNIEQMAKDYEAETKNTNSKELYLIHRYGLGADEWTYYVPNDEKYDKYKK